MSKKIGIVINSSWNIFNFRRGVIKQFLAEGYEVHAIAPSDGFSEKLEEIGCIFHHTPVDTRGNNPINDILYAYQLYRLYKSLDLDLVLHYTIKPNIYGTLAAHLAGIPTINNVTGLGTVFLHNNWVSKLSRWMYRFTFRYPNLVFFQNSDDRKLFLDHKLIKPELADLLPGSGVDIRYHVPEFPITENKTFTFLMVSRLLYDKGIIEFIEAGKLLKKEGLNCKLQLLGNVDHTGKYGLTRVDINYWQDEGIIEYLGCSNDVRPFLSHADCVVLPSYREGTPRSLLEAACHQKPLIASNVPGCREVVFDGFNGLLCQEKSTESLAEKMFEMIKMPSNQRLALGNNSRKLMEERFDEKFVVNKYAVAAQQILAGKPVFQHVEMSNLKLVPAIAD